jgi:hypothetical protein
MNIVGFVKDVLDLKLCDSAVDVLCVILNCEVLHVIDCCQFL